MPWLRPKPPYVFWKTECVCIRSLQQYMSSPDRTERATPGLRTGTLTALDD
jgi:hypothetical protein